MADVPFMRKVNVWAKRARGCDDFMGGIQLCAIGDFCQTLDEEEYACERRAGEDDAAYIARLKALAEGWRREAREIGAEEAKSA